MRYYSQITVTDQQQDWIDQHLKTYHFPWYYYGHQVNKPPRDCYRDRPMANVPFWAHTLVLPSDDPDQEGQINSEHWPFFVTVFDQWARSNRIAVTKIYRASVNLVHHAVPGALYTVPHLDHQYPHWNWIWYLDSVEGAETLVFDEQGEITAEYPCRRNWCLSFAGEEHSHRLPPDQQIRRIAVITYQRS